MEVCEAFSKAKEYVCIIKVIEILFYAYNMEVCEAFSKAKEYA